uniref:NADH-ubiquinone oxidoreductase chain 4 n=1 Tax=Rhinebothrium megacanthophallus TaxID=595946 RepID=A0A8K1SWR7_9CEST|nr:NADH dehydrogenase subunit 4 [Rhinebothrium megacanthophallus]
MSVFNFVSCSIFLGLGSLIFFLLSFSCGVNVFNFSAILWSDYFMFDSLSFYLILLVVFLGALSLICLDNFLSSHTKLYLIASLIFSILCFSVNHAVLFWCLYELSMLPLLFLIFKDSPYSERFIAGWYFAVYLIITSLPLILILLYLSSVNSSMFFNSWSADSASTGIFITLSFIFFTKVPLCPFHTWLPIVHAEATSIVSIFLSGYIMKLGLLGVFRCTPFIFGGTFYFYLFFCFVLSVFFLITASTELDGKRWLAFLSLSHIVVGFLAYFVGDWEGVSFSFIFCLGHGLSAGLVFGFLWLCYDVSASRNWLLLKESFGGKTISILGVISILSLCSFPPTLQFFCEVNLLIASLNSVAVILFWCLYLFFGGLVPLILCGHLLIRSESVEGASYSSFSFMFYFSILAIWCYLGVFIL